MAKPEFPPLLAPGFYDFSVRELQEFCVAIRPRSATRGDIMHGLRMLILELVKNGLHGILWVDGSFLTEKIDPGDVDLLLSLPNETRISGTAEQRNTIAWYCALDRKQTHFCDTHIHYTHPLGHAEHGNSQSRLLDYWRDSVFGISLVGRVLKGIAAIRLPEGAI